MRRRAVPEHGDAGWMGGGGGHDDTRDGLGGWHGWLGGQV